MRLHIARTHPGLARWLPNRQLAERWPSETCLLGAELRSCALDVLCFSEAEATPAWHAIVYLVLHARVSCGSSCQGDTLGLWPALPPQLVYVLLFRCEMLCEDSNGSEATLALQLSALSQMSGDLDIGYFDSFSNSNVPAVVGELPIYRGSEEPADGEAAEPPLLSRQDRFGGKWGQAFT